MSGAEPPDKEGAELVPDAGSQTEGVQDLGYLGISVLEQAIDLGNDRWIRAPQLVSTVERAACVSSRGN